jgi:hypothetical protein
MWHISGMAKRRVSTTVDEDLLARARALDPAGTDASMLEQALRALIERNRRAQVDAAYVTAFAEHPLEEPDDWGDLASFGEAVSQR